MPPQILRMVLPNVTDRALLAAAIVSGKPPKWKREAAVAAAREGNVRALVYICGKLKEQRPVKRSKHDSRWFSLMRDVCVAATEAGSEKCLIFATGEQRRYRYGNVLTLECALKAYEAKNFWILSLLVKNYCPVNDYLISEIERIVNGFPYRHPTGEYMNCDLVYEAMLRRFYVPDSDDDYDDYDYDDE